MIVVSLRVVVINEAIDNVIIAIVMCEASFFMYRSRFDVDASVGLPLVLPMFRA